MKASASPALLLFSLALLLTGCVSNRYKSARKDTPPPQLLNVTLARSPLEVGLGTLITFNGPGSWKRDAFWDEYVVSLRNPGPVPITVSSLTLVDAAGVGHAPGVKPWDLEKESKSLEQKYLETGLAFVRYTAPGVLILGAGAGYISTVSIFSSAAAGAEAVTLIALPLYYLGVCVINLSNKAAMENEFNHRRLVLPLTLAPGDARSGSLFFPMVPSPRSLNLHWADGPAQGEAVLPLGFLAGLHLKPPAAPATRTP